jgi:hypothetical protein
MSRMYDAEDDGAIPEGLWMQAVTLAISGPRGVQAMAELEEALLRLPRRRLILEDISNGQDVCALGALVLKRERELYPNQTVDDLIDEMYHVWGDEGLLAVQECGENLGLRRTLAWLVTYQNDETFGRDTPETRWFHMLNWCRAIQDKEPYRDPGAVPRPGRRRARAT